MNDQKYLDQLNEIQTMMNRSTRFLSLSGLSGILAGCFALIGVLLVYCQRNLIQFPLELNSSSFWNLVLISVGVLVCSLVSALILSKRKASKSGEPIWNEVSKRFLIHFSIPLLTGGIFAILLILKGEFLLISPITLLFYGMALLNASKYTYEAIRSLGIVFIVLGLLNVMFTGYGLCFWAIGFGFCHIIYGSYMYFKLERNVK